MKIFVFIFLFLFSPLSFSMEIDICLGSGCPPPIECVYNPDNGFTVCLPMNSDGTVSNTNPTQVCDANGCINVFPAATAGVWNPKTFSCSNYVAPKVGAAGDIICPAASTTATPTSKVAPNPSKDDVACDPSKGVDSGCASQKTAAKTNDLLSESNSKLGSIASSNANNSGLLGQILGTLRGIASQGTAGTGTGTGSGGTGGTGSTGTGTGSGSGSGGSTGGGTGSSGDGTGASEGVTTSTKQISSVSASNSSGICPTPESFSIAGQSYSFSYESLCNMAESMRGIVIAIGAFSALMIVVTAL